MDWKVFYKPKHDDLTTVLVSAASREEAIQKVKREYWDVEDIICCSKMN